MTSKVPSLVELASNKCIQNVAKLHDLGITPFHLLRRILGRMNAKQLAHVEELNPHVMPHTDVLWPALIEREFPDRPLYLQRRRTPQQQLKGTLEASLAIHSSMPNKALYFRYNDERESFRDDSAKRLRRITERLKKEKSAKSIVAVPQLLRDPTVRRRAAVAGGSSSWRTGGGTPSYKRNTILDRARHDLRKRPQTFPGKIKPYDPYAAFFEPEPQPQPPRRAASPPNGQDTGSGPGSARPRRRAPTAFNTMETRTGAHLRTSATPVVSTPQPPKIIHPSPKVLPKIGRPPVKPSITLLPPPPGTSPIARLSTPPPPPPPLPLPYGSPPPPIRRSPTRPRSSTPPPPPPPPPSSGGDSPTNALPNSPVAIPPPRKRRPQPSIFLTRKRPTPRASLGRGPSPAAKPATSPPPPPPTDAPPKLKAVRSSIFS